MNTKFLFLSSLFFLLLCGESKGQVNIATLGVAFTDSFTLFDGSADPTHWTSSDAAGTSIWQGQNTGSSTSGGKYAYGNGVDTDYALGFLPTSTREIYIDLVFTNSSGATISSLDITYVGEQWRSANGGRINGWEVSCDIGNTGSFTPITALQYQAVNTNPSGALDGNDAANRSAKSTSIGGLSIADGASFTIRFFGDNGIGSGSRQGVAIDDFSLTADGATPVTYTYNNSWDNDPSGIATSSDVINITAGNATISANTSCNNLSIEPGASLTVNSGFSVEVSGTALIKADAGAYAQVLGSVTTTGAGVVLWQSYLNDGERWYNNAFATNGSTLANVSGIVLNYTNSAATHNVYKYTEASGSWEYASASDSTDNIAYQIYGSSNFGGIPARVQIQGSSLKDATQTIAVTNTTDGFNYIPNPYPSVLDWKAVYNDYTGANILGNQNISNDVIYTQTGSPNATTFDTYNAATDLTTNNGSRYLAPGQAFFVKVNAAGNLTFDNSVRVINQTPGLNKTATNVYALKLASKDVSTHILDETVVAFSNQFSTAIDRTDGPKELNEGIQNLYTKINGKAFVHNNRDAQFQTLSEPVFFQAPIEGTFSLELSEIRVPLGWVIVLEDKLTGLTRDLRKGSYMFKHLKGNATDRFILHINKPSTGVTLEKQDLAEAYAYREGENVFVNLQHVEGEILLSLYDIGGRLIKQISTTGHRLEQLSLAQVPEGVYLLKVSQAGKAILKQKMIK